MPTYILCLFHHIRNITQLITTISPKKYIEVNEHTGLSPHVRLKNITYVSEKLLKLAEIQLASYTSSHTLVKLLANITDYQLPGHNIPQYLAGVWQAPSELSGEPTWFLPVPLLGKIVAQFSGHYPGNFSARNTRCGMWACERLEMLETWELWIYFWLNAWCRLCGYHRMVAPETQGAAYHQSNWQLLLLASYPLL